MLVNTLFIDFSDGKQENVQQYEVQCDAQRKQATVSIISTEELDRYKELARLAESANSGEVEATNSDPHDPSDIVFISICVLAVILMLIAIVWLVLL